MSTAWRIEWNLALGRNGGPVFVQGGGQSSDPVQRQLGLPGDRELVHFEQQPNRTVYVCRRDGMDSLAAEALGVTINGQRVRTP